MSKRSAEQMLQSASAEEQAAAAGAAAVAATSNVALAAPPHSGSSTRRSGGGVQAAAGESAAVGADEDMGTTAATAQPAASTPAPTRKGGRAPAVVEIRPAQVEAMKHIATASEHGVDCPSWYGFKSASFVAKRQAGIGPGRQWRNMKQIIDRENFHLMAADTPTYVSIRSAPSSLPVRKYCDVSGLPAAYTDPRTRLHFHSTSEYKQIQAQSTDTIKIMLELRGQTPTHQLMLR